MAKITTPLTATQVKSAAATDKPYKLSDGGGLYLYVSNTGVKSWRIDYRKPINKKRATITLGKYPDITLAQARLMRAEIKSDLAIGIDPSKKRKDTERAQLLEQNNTFEALAEEYINHRKDELSPETTKHSLIYARYLNEVIADIPINKVKPIDVLDACRKVERKGYHETAKKMQTFASQVFRYAVQTARCERDITQDLRGALKTPQVKHYAAIIDPVEFGHLLSAIDSYDGRFETRIAIKLMPLLFVRSGELRHALWDEIDLDNATWSFTPRKTKRKTGVSLVVPLSTQALSLFKELSEHRRGELVFPSVQSKLRPMSDNTMNQALKRLGYSGDQHTIHGFRATARTLLVEKLGFDEQLVEMQLGHRVRDMHGRAYNRVTWLDKRTEMMQAWADYIDELKVR